MGQTRVPGLSKGRGEFRASRPPVDRRERGHARTRGKVRRHRLLAVALMSLAAVASNWSLSGAAEVVPLCLGVEATIVGTPGTDVLRGTARDDVIVGGGSGHGSAEYGDEIFGVGGNDLICADSEDDRVETITHGGEGDDQILATGNLHGGPGNDTLTTTAIHGSVLHLVGGPGDDVLEAGSGDVIIFAPGPGNDRVTGDRAGQSWNVMRFGRARAGVVADLRAGTATGQGHDLLSGINVVDGTDSADAFFGDAHLNALFGFGSDDVLDGRARRDFLIGGGGDDRVDGGGGNDELTGGAGRDVLFGRAGNDSLLERRPEPNLILGGPGRDNCAGGYRTPPNIERGCETHRRPAPDGGG